MVVDFPSRKLREFPQFHVCPAFNNCFAAKCASGQNSVWRDFDVFRTKMITIKFDKKFSSCHKVP